MYSNLVNNPKYSTHTLGPQLTCCLVLRVGFTEMCISLIARSIRVTVYGRFVSGFTHLSATTVAISLNIISC